MCAELVRRPFLAEGDLAGKASNVEGEMQGDGSGSDQGGSK
jgi:hypothetical protein